MDQILTLTVSIAGGHFITKDAPATSGTDSPRMTLLHFYFSAGKIIGTLGSLLEESARTYSGMCHMPQLAS